MTKINIDFQINIIYIQVDFYKRFLLLQVKCLKLEWQDGSFRVSGSMGASWRSKGAFLFPQVSQVTVKSSVLLFHCVSSKLPRNSYWI